MMQLVTYLVQSHTNTRAMYYSVLECLSFDSRLVPQDEEEKLNTRDTTIKCPFILSILGENIRIEGATRPRFHSNIAALKIIVKYYKMDINVKKWLFPRAGGKKRHLEFPSFPSAFGAHICTHVSRNSFPKSHPTRSTGRNGWKYWHDQPPFIFS